MNKQYKKRTHREFRNGKRGRTQKWNRCGFGCDGIPRFRVFQGLFAILIPVSWVSHSKVGQLTCNIWSRLGGDIVIDLFLRHLAHPECQRWDLWPRYVLYSWNLARPTNVIDKLLQSNSEHADRLVSPAISMSRVSDKIVEDSLAQSRSCTRITMNSSPGEIYAFGDLPAP